MGNLTRSLMLGGGGSAGGSGAGTGALVAALGDSIVANSFYVNTNFSTYAMHGFMTWAMGFSMGSLWCPLVAAPNVSSAVLNYNRGVSGETAAQTLARITEIDALPVKPSFCVVMTGTNDTGVTTPATASSISATIISICTGLLSRGITPILCTLLPRGNGTSSGGSNGWSALSTVAQVKTSKGLLLEINRQLRAYAAATNGVVLADTFYSILDYTTTWSDPVSTLTGAASATPDYLHPNVPGSVKVGEAVWAAIAPLVPTAARQAAGTGDGYDATYNPNGSMLDSSFAAAGGTSSTGMSSPAAWAGTTAYTVNTIVINAAGVSYRCAVAGTSGSAAPVHTVGQAVDGTAVWEVLSTTATAGTPAGWTSGRLLGASATATINVQKRADGKPGNEEVIAITSAENAQFRTYEGSSSPSNANFMVGDVIYTEAEFEWDCGSGGYYAAPNYVFKFTTSAYAGTYETDSAGSSSAVTTHVQGKGRVLLRSPLIDCGLTTPIGGINMWTICGARSSGSGKVLTTIRNVAVRKYNKSAPGAITWTAVP